MKKLLQTISACLFAALSSFGQAPVKKYSDGYIIVTQKDSVIDSTHVEVILKSLDTIADVKVRIEKKEEIMKVIKRSPGNKN